MLLSGVVYIILLASCQVNLSSSAKILGIFPSMSRSHFIVGELLMEELAARGHNVTVLSPYPRSQPMKNYYDLDVQGVHKKVHEKIPSLLDFGTMSFLDRFRVMYEMGLIITNHTLHHEKVQNMLNDPNEHFDLVIPEAFLNEAMHGIAHHFNAPIVAISTLGSSIWTNYMVGSPVPLSYVSGFFMPYVDQKTLCQRIHSTLYAIAEYFYHNFVYFQMQNKIYEEVFPEPKPSLWDLHRNISLVLLNNHFTLNYPTPYVPNMIEVGGIQINRKTRQLPEDLQKYLDDAKDGAIFFSLGSNIPSHLLAPEKKAAILKTFSKLKQKILWKWDETNIPNLSDNVLVRNWFPQDDVMAHPNVKLFITHGGLLSLTEAVYNGVPIIGIPLFADQFMNMIKATNEGVGLSLTFEELDEPKLSATINEVLSKPSFAENMKRLSELYLDQPMTPLDTAIYWIEYVIRHKGARHMRSASQNFNFFQYHNLDVFGIIIGSIIGVLTLLIFTCKVIFCRKTTAAKQSKIISKKVKKS